MNSVNTEQNPSGGLYAELNQRLGVSLADNLLEHAFTHRSFAYENGGLPTNERLEFLGDSVLGVIVTESLFRNHPDLKRIMLPETYVGHPLRKDYPLTGRGERMDFPRYVP